MQFNKSILIAAVAVLAPIAGHAATITSNPTLSVDGLNFSSFSCTLSLGGSAANPSDCSQINVNTITSPAEGIRISSGFSAQGASFDDAVVDYHVTSATGISSIGLDFNGFFDGYGVSSVTESVYSGDHLIGYTKVISSDSATNRAADINLHGVYSDLYVVKDINVTGNGGNAEASFIDQTFVQATPEPSSIALFGTGLLSAFGLLRRRSIHKSAEVK